VSVQPAADCLQHFPGVALEVSVGGVVRASNGRLDALVGRELVGVALADVLDSSSQAKLRRLLSDSPPAHPTCTWELVLRTPGTMQLMSFLVVRQPAADASLWLLEYSVNPKLERLYGELSELHRELVQSQRELGRQKRQLARALHAAEKAVRTRDEVLAIVSHDLRSPLGTITMAAGLLEMPIAEEKKVEQIGIIRRSATAMTRLIGDLLDVGAAESGRLAVELRPTDVREVLEEACRMAESAAARKEQRFEWSVPADLPRAPADRDRLLQVLSNLLGNAIKFTPAGGAITLRAEAADGEIVVSIEDTGPGIAEADLTRIFDWFWHASRKRRGGSGLGLAIARGIAEAHGGRILVESTPGQGSSFSVVLPVGQGEQRA
jgi:signal transduction histidine kinase